MEQRHAGSGDNVAGNKTTVNNISVPKIIGFTLLGVSLFAVAYLLWPDPVYLSGYVYSSGGRPEEGVSLVVNSADGDEYQSVSNAEGFFQFERLTVKRAQTGRLLVRKDVRELSLALDSLAPTETGLRLRLPAGTPPFSVSYYNLGAHAIDQVLQGKTREVLIGDLADETYVLPNAVNDYYQELLSEHGRPLDQSYYLQRPWSEEDQNRMSWEESFAAGRPDDTRLLPGKGGAASTDNIMYAELSRTQVQQLLTSDNWRQQGEMIPENLPYERESEYSSTLAVAWLDKANWDATTRAMLAAEGEAMQDYLAYEAELAEGYPSPEAYMERTLEQYLRPKREEINFWNTVMGDALPPELIMATISQGSSCGAASFQVYISLPELYLQVAVLENISESPIRLDTFVFRTLEAQPLRPELEVLAKIEETAPRRDRLFPRQQLAPGEKLLIPQYFYARTNEDAYVHPTDAGYRGIRDEAFLQSPDKDRPPYVFGPVFRISTVLLGPELYAFRGFDREKLVLIDGTEMGSCPYAYTRAHAAAPWRLEDHLIYGRSKANREGVDTLALHQFDGYLMIREKDPETSYLQYVYLIVDRADGTHQDLQPDVVRLRHGQPDYHVMEQGDSILLRFPDFRAQPEDRYRLVSAGYYLPYEPDFSYRLQMAAARVESGVR